MTLLNKAIFKTVSQCSAMIGSISIMVISLLSGGANAMTVSDLRVEYLKDPVGIDVAKPRLSWIVQSNVRGDKQTAYRILAASSMANCDANTGDLWDTGKLLSDESANTQYNGLALASRKKVFWKVMVWDNTGVASPWSGVAQWSMGLLTTGDWGGANWIGLEGGVTVTNDRTRVPARYVRTEFNAAKTITRASASVCGLGFFEFYINGQKVGDQIMTPALTHFSKRDLYVSFDVSDKVKTGRNAIGVILGNSKFYLPRASQINSRYPMLLFCLQIENNDGTLQTVVSDNTWKITADGPIVANNEYDGEEYDARKEMPGWADSGYSASGWQQAQIVTAPGGVLEAQKCEPNRVIQIVKPVSVTPLPSNVYIVDFGQNFYGVPRLTVNGAAGTRVEMTEAYSLRADGTLKTEDNRTALATDVYTLKGSAASEIWNPVFRGQGFRRISVVGFPGTPTAANFEGLVIHADVDTTGHFSCSNTLINKIHSNIRWGQRMFMRTGVPLDPDRDERQGWQGDPSKDAESEAFNFNVLPFYSKWLVDISMDQYPDGSIPQVVPELGYTEAHSGILWPSVKTIVPDWAYAFYRDKRILQDNYASMKNWIEFISAGCTISTYTGGDYGDWCDCNSMYNGGDCSNQYTDISLISSAYLYNNTMIMARVAGILGNTADQTRYATYAAIVKNGFNTKYLNASNEYKGDRGPSQSGYVFPLQFDLVPDANKNAVINNLVNDILEENGGHLTGGLLGMQWLLQTLTKTERLDVAYKVATRICRPGWGYMALKGATTIWERWDTDTQGPGMNSEALLILAGNVDAWFYQTLAGINYDTANPGFKNIILKPYPADDLTWVKADFKSVYGLVESNWSISGTTFTWNIIIPANATARISIPSKYSQNIKEGGVAAELAQGVTYVGDENGAKVYNAVSGSYTFTSMLRAGYVPPPVNLSLAGAASASTTYPGYSAANVNDGDQAPFVNEGCSWANAENVALPQWVQIDLGGNRTFNRIELWSSKGYVIRDYQVQYWNGTSWVDAVPSITGNVQFHRTHHFSTVTGSKIRVLGNSGPDNQTGYIRVNELEVYDDSISHVGLNTGFMWGPGMQSARTTELTSGITPGTTVSASSEACAPDRVARQASYISAASFENTVKSTSQVQAVSPVRGVYTIAFMTTKGDSAPSAGRPPIEKQASVQTDPPKRLERPSVPEPLPGLLKGDTLDAGAVMLDRKEQASVQKDKIIQGSAALRGIRKKYGIRILLSSASTGSRLVNTLTDKNGNYALCTRYPEQCILSVDPPKRLKAAYVSRSLPLTLDRDTLDVGTVMLDRKKRK